jgi:hypothetical protein
VNWAVARNLCVLVIYRDMHVDILARNPTLVRILIVQKDLVV